MSLLVLVPTPDFSDLQLAARFVEGKKIAPNLTAIVVPGSRPVKRAAEKLGLDKVFLDAGFEWRDPGCSMCLGMNPDKVPDGGPLCLYQQPKF